MQNIKISSKVDEAIWNELKALAQEQHQNVSGLLTEAIREYVKRKTSSPSSFRSLGILHDRKSGVGGIACQVIPFSS